MTKKPLVTKKWRIAMNAATPPVFPALVGRLTAHFGPKKFRINAAGDIVVFKPSPNHYGWVPFGNIKNADVRRKVAGL